MIWGPASRVDAFVSGRVVIGADRRSLSVVYRYFDAQDPAKWHDGYTSKSIRLTKQILTDLGYSYSAPKNNTIVARSSDNSHEDLIVPVDPSDTLPVDNAAKLSGAAPQPGTTEALKPVPDKSSATTSSTMPTSVHDLVELKIYYDGQEQPLPPGATMVPPPQRGQRIHFTSKAREKVGVVLTVNGQNTADGNTSDAEVARLSKWVLEPNKLYTVAGFHKDGKVGELIAEDPNIARAANKIPSEHSGSVKLGQIFCAVLRMKQADATSTTLNNRENTATYPTPKAANEAMKEKEKTNENGTVSKNLIIEGEKSDKVVEVENLVFEPAACITRSITYFQMPKPTAVPSGN